MPISDPYLLVSVGYDTSISFFDIREKAVALKISQNFGINTIASSECGYYIASGDLRGNIDCYDLRNMKIRLNQKQVHNDKITRVTFVPSNDGNLTEIDNIRQSSRFSMPSSIPILNDVPEVLVPDRRDSLYSVMSERALRREFSPETRMSTGSRLSTDSRFSFCNYRKRFDEFLNSSDDDTFAILSEIQNNDPDFNKSDDHVNNLRLKSKKSNILSSIATTRKSMTKDISQMRSKNLKRESILQPVIENLIEEKENVAEKSVHITNEITDDKNDLSTGILKSLQTNDSSTPNYKAIPPSNGKIVEEMEALNKKFEKLSNRQNQQDTILKSEFSMIKHQIERMHAHNYKTNFTFFFKQEQEIEDIKNSIGLLVNCVSEIVQENQGLKVENQSLKMENETLKRKSSVKK